MRRIFLIILLIIVGFIAFGQKQIEVPLAKPCPYGYLEFIPACETVTENCQVVNKCPDKLLISLDGFGERGNGTTELYKVANAGVAKLIRDGQWTRTEFIVISPQLFTGQNMYSPKTLNVFINQMRFKYKIDSTEIYLVGLSGGANSIYAYITTYKGIAAAIAISGYGNYKLAANAIPTRIWEFHGEKDTTVPLSTKFNSNYKYALESRKCLGEARLTVWPGLGHTGWQEVLSGKWLDKTSLYDPYNENIFEWLLK
jgi:predicted peptidase